MTWDASGFGGDGSAFQEQLDVQHIRASQDSFAALLGDGSVVTWGHSPFSDFSVDGVQGHSRLFLLFLATDRW
jgi:hypothetical protein